MTKFKRIFGIVIDSIGIGQAPDADNFGDVGADTLGSIGAKYQGNFAIPTLAKLGLSNIRPENPIINVPVQDQPSGYFGKMREISAGKDSMDGHFEMMGVPVTETLGFFPQGFPSELIKQLEDFSGRKVIVNKPYSGTEVLKDYGEEQLQTGALIVYTSGDSVLQIAANTDVIPLEELYKISEYARSITTDAPYHIGRIIARPYVGTNKDDFERTSDRHDYALLPSEKTDLERLQEANLDVIGIGKIVDIFSGVGLTEKIHTTSNHDGMEQMIATAKKDFTGFAFLNLVDFDAKYGHRRDVNGDGDALMEFDQQLADLISELKPTDLMFITADHGNDPGFKGTDHTREFVPLLVYSPSLPGNKSLGIRQTYSDLGQTILENFGITGSKNGQSFLSELN